MSHDHDHGAMLASTTASINHDRHSTGHQMNTTIGAMGHGLHMQDMMMMAMTFHGGHKEKILFDQWDTKTVGVFVASWFAVFFLAVLYEALKTLRDYLSKRDFCPQCVQTQNRPQPFRRTDDQECERSNDDHLIPSVRTENFQTKRVRLLSLPHGLQTILHIIQMTMSYSLMLVAMTFNTYLFFAVVLGAGFGHFLFGWRRSSVIDHNEHCH